MRTTTIGRSPEIPYGQSAAAPSRFPASTLSGGRSPIRRDMQTMNNGRMTIQLDNFDGKGITPAVFEIAWVRVYNV